MLRAVVVLGLLLACPSATADTLQPPGCTSVPGTPGSPIAGVAPRFVKMPGPPFGLAPAKGGRVFVSLPQGSIAVLGGGTLRDVSPALRPSTPYGIQLSRDGSRLYAADGLGLASYSTARLMRGSRAARLERHADFGDGAIYVRLSADGGYAFVADEFSASVAVFRLRSHLKIVGEIPVSSAPVGLALSHDGRRLFVTTEEGWLTEIDVAAAERNPPSAVRRRVQAGCSPVRVVLSPDGRSLWVSARASNAVLGFDEQSLALTAVVPVGSSPVGLVFIGPHTLAVANSNRFAATQAPQTLSIVDTATSELRGSVSAGVFPREVALSPDGRLLYLTNFGSNTVEIVSVAELRL